MVEVTIGGWAGGGSMESRGHPKHIMHGDAVVHTVMTVAVMR